MHFCGVLLLVDLLDNSYNELPTNFFCKCFYTINKNWRDVQRKYVLNNIEMSSLM